MKEKRMMKNNTLFNEIIRIDFFKINNLPTILSNLDDYMKELKYSFNTTDIRNVNINIEDPETLLTQEMIKSNINTTVNYEYVSENGSEKFVLNEYFLIFEKYKFDNYKNIDEYLKVLQEIIKVIIKEEKEIKVSRIGIRKMNQLFIGNLNVLNNYINDQRFPKPDEEDVVDEYNIVQKNLGEEDSSNVMLSLKKGKGSIGTIQDKDMYRIVWDIDCYYRNTEKNKIKEKIEELNDKLFEKYNKIITSELKQILNNEHITNEDLYKKEIYGGINKNNE
ncbi:MAG: hypothetical protein BHW00_01540 [Clostridium sp. 26_22]|nr:MAG: hypothetical protein BHW00_01540 [Clostridium sp. 26_22]